MKGVKSKLFLIFSISLLLVVPFASAGIFDYFTGKATSNGCIETDKGIDEFDFGYVFRSGGGSGMADICTNADYVSERYCSDSGNFAVKSIKCEYGCYGGECNTKEECESSEGCKKETRYCRDDGDFYLKGETYLVFPDRAAKGLQSEYFKGVDGCSGNRVEEYACNEAGEVVRRYVTCPEGCNAGACIKGPLYEESLTTTCEETDAGYKIYEKGTLTYSGKSYEDVCYTSSLLTEYHCDPNFGILKKTNTGCQYGCREGVCLTPDSPYAKKIVRTNSEGTQETQSESSPPTTNENEESESSESGGESTDVTSGEEEKSDDIPYTCEDSDGGRDIFVKGRLVEPSTNSDYIDSCLDASSSRDANLNGGNIVLEGSVLREHYCGIDNYKYEYVDCPEGCYDGACLEVTPNSQETGDNGEEGDTSNGEVSSGEDLILCSDLGGVLCSEAELCKGVKNYKADDDSYNSPCCMGVCYLKPTLEEMDSREGLYYYEEEVCSGCLVEGDCYAYGYRLGNEYCSLEGETMLSQKSEKSSCSNNFECQTNLCLQNECVELSVIERIWNFITGRRTSSVSGRR